MKISKPKRITSANVKSESREAVDTVATSTNSFNNEVYIAIMGQLGVTDNLNMSFVTTSINVDANGIPNRTVKFKSNLKSGKTQMILCGRVFNALPTSGVTVGFSEDSGIITLTHLTGLTADTEYSVTLLVIGN